MTVTAPHRIGQQSEWTATFSNAAGARVDPNVVRFKWQRVGSGDAPTTFVYGTDSEVQRTGLGVFVFTSPAYTESGTYVCWCESESPSTANERTVDVIGRMLVEV